MPIFAQFSYLHYPYSYLLHLLVTKFQEFFQCCFHLGVEFLNLMDGSAMLEVENVFVKPDKSWNDYLEVRTDKLKN